MDSVPKSGMQLLSAFVYNDSDNDLKVIDSIDNEIQKCKSFDFSVAFITLEGVQSILQTLDNLRNVAKGRILTSDFLNFNEPRALRKLLEFPNIKVRIFPIEKERAGFHTKGYIFHNEDETAVIMGSSNLTANALSKNKEWNVKISSKTEKGVIDSVMSEFERMWGESDPLTAGWIDSYELKYIQNKNSQSRQRFPAAEYPEALIPNKMQEEALLRLRKLRENNQDKALLISATGTGKTYLSAFDVKESGAKKVLFLVHNDQILTAAMNSYGKVFGPSVKMGKVTGEHKQFDADFIFSTTQSMSRDYNQTMFQPDHFDYIVCDEAHHAAASQYGSILNYFKPKFMLGMTATPERTDKADVFGLFNNNIAYEIRLQDALRNEMLCPFHYYGVQDITVDGKLLDDNSEFRYLVSDERVKHIQEKAGFYGYSGNRVKGLIFCSRIDEGEELSQKLNQNGWRTRFICGKTSQEERREVVKRLEQKESEGALDYVITVDIFNEGVDIKTVNQVIMLRPTESAIIFIQQLGRGLRKVESDGEKEYLVVIDFIGNYNNNFLIPIALSGNAPLSKEGLRRFLRAGSIPGCSTISFDRISQSRIYESINNTKDLTKLIKDKYCTLVKMLGYEPNQSQLLDLMETSTAPIDPLEIIDKYGTFNEFKRVTKHSHYKFDETEKNLLKYVSKDLMKGFRPQELMILSEVIEHGSVDLQSLKEKVHGDYSVDFDESLWDSAVSVLDGTFDKDLCPYIKTDGTKLVQSEDLKKSLETEGFRESMEDSIECGLKIYKNKYSDANDGLFKLYERYGRFDVLRILGCPKKIPAQNIGGYYIKKDLHVCPIFVTYDKNKSINKSIQYDDRFINNETFFWMTQNNRKLTSPEVTEILNPLNRLYLFIKKNDDESTDFYYMGRVFPIADSVEEVYIKNDKGEDLPVVTMHFKLESPVPEKLYAYITQKIQTS